MEEKDPPMPAYREPLRSAAPTPDSASPPAAYGTRTPAAAPGAHSGALPAYLRRGVEALSGLTMDDVQVHRNSPEPAKLGALAFTRGTEIHLGPGQEQHLPHEAWHVVQQKQGRVRADTALPAGAASADPALESEADRMAELAMGEPAAPSTPAAARVHAPVLQAKVKSGGSWLAPSDPVSPTLLGFIRSAGRYQLRDDYQDRLLDEPVHLLDMSKKYIFGELHGAAANAGWEEQVRNWSGIDKMFEGYKELPDRDLRDVGLPYDGERQELALENLHAYLLLVVMRSITELNVLEAPWVRPLWTSPEFNGSVRGFIAGAKKQLAEADYPHKQYGDFAEAFENERRHSLRSHQIYIFARKFAKVYHPGIEGLDTDLSVAAEAVDAYDESDPAKAAEAETKFEGALDSIAAGRGFLRDMAMALVDLNEIVGEERQVIENLLAATDQHQGAEILKALDPARERGMAANVSAAASPLFVKTGSDHVENLTRMVGDRAVAIRPGESLEELTERP